MILEYKNQIIDYIEAVDMNPLLKVKAASMFHRFESQEIAIHEINKSGKYFFGGGPGITRTLNDRDMNLHNTYYQMYVEIGGVMLFIVAFFLFYYMLDIKNVSFLLLFGIMSLFGNMLEVFYAPVLSFISFITSFAFSPKGFAEFTITINGFPMLFNSEIVLSSAAL